MRGRNRPYRSPRPFDSFAALPGSAQGRTARTGETVDSVARKIEGAAGAALLQTNELLQDRARTEKAAFYGQGDDLPSQGATWPQFATRAVCV